MRVINTMVSYLLLFHRVVEFEDKIKSASSPAEEAKLLKELNQKLNLMDEKNEANKGKGSEF